MNTTADINVFKSKSNNKIDWKTIGIDNQVFDNNHGPFITNGIVFQVLKPSSFMLNTQDVLGGGTWPGNFFDTSSNSSTIRIFYTNGHRSPVKIVFSTPIKGIGIQIQQAYGISSGEADASFRATLKCFKTGEKEIYTTPPLIGHTSKSTSEIIFLSAYDDKANIDAIEIHNFPITPSNVANDFAIGPIYLIV